MSKAFKTLQDRGFISQMTSEDLLGWEQFHDKPTVYIGFDLTARSLHVGSLIQLMALRVLVDAGHKVIALVGEATTKVGDPSGKDKSRPMLSEAEISNNRAGITKVIHKLVPEALIVSNGEWFNNSMSFVDFLRDFGAHFTINRMNTFDTVKRRLENQDPMTFLEYTYMLLQAVDFLKLFEQHGCTVQMGGSDQWGNIVNGVELVRRVHGDTVFGVTTPLLTDKSGKKMGKTAGGAIWLDADMTAPFDFFQFWRNVEDEKVTEFTKLFVDKSPLPGVDINQRKEDLAFQVTSLVHGVEVAQQCLETAHAVFRNGGVAKEEAILPGEMLTQVIARLGFAESRSAARRLITGAAVSVDDVKVSEDITAQPGMLLKVGKKKTARLI